MNFYDRALELREETVAHRRWLHRNAEVGLYMPKRQNYVKSIRLDTACLRAWSGCGTGQERGQDNSASG